MLIKHLRQRSVGRAKVCHAVVVIFLEFFAWGLLTTPMLTVLHETFPQHTFLMNGLIQGVKSFLLLTVFFTCAPIPLMRISPWWFFALMSISGLFSVTFSVIFAYVADITEDHERSTAYGLVSATFAASLVTSPALGAFLSRRFGVSVVVLLATIISLLDILFILLLLPESLPEKITHKHISWSQADPFTSLRKVGKDSTVLLICVTVFLSYLPEAGQYSSFFLYLGQVINFSPEAIAGYIAMVGILSIGAQTMLLSLLMKKIGSKRTVLLGLSFQLFQLTWYGFGSQSWMMWAAGAVAALSSISFPAVSALVSSCTDHDQQGAVQGMITGIRGLCNGLGPALFGFIFFLFHVELKEMNPAESNPVPPNPEQKSVIPGPPFLFGACSVLLALLVALFIPTQQTPSVKTCSSHMIVVEPKSHASLPVSDEDHEPLLQDSSL
ncbi:hypothetical protein DNTS_014530 [Danionella cerebrum]|uniref:Major facilitator superfamily (MFS) profile domain-containing protein n=1 Tax=Danionella cerebrum TaxID=2873325 RepID=A0A553RLR6_9TELE|nr:hypothetical protein DNTS_014530 [Danionella translucida]